jgi:glycosyltransferase involved in cell wall biosynthesis
VTWFASSAAGHPEEEVIDGIRILRKYSQHTVWLMAWHWYRKFRKSNRPDLIIDEAGGWPLLSPWYEKHVPLLFFAHHVGDREFDAYPWIVGKLAKWWYRKTFSFYRKIPTVTISESTKAELVKDFRFPAENVTVISLATDVAPVREIDWKAKSNDVLFLGRLTPIKRAEHAVLAFASVLGRLPADSRLTVVGSAQDSEYGERVRQVVRELGIADRVIFRGRIDRSDFPAVIASHRCILVPSQKE